MKSLIDDGNNFQEKQKSNFIMQACPTQDIQ